MDLLIGERQQVGIATLQDLSDYHLQFLAITWWLTSKEHLVVLEQQRTYVRAFQPHFLSQIMNRLSIKMTDHHPNIPYKIKDVHEAVCFILQGTLAPVVPTVSPSYQFPRTTSQRWICQDRDPNYNDGRIYQIWWQNLPNPWMKP